ncbi:unnamed protein product, partial [Nippostrongylus brasiliensis]|uniref:PhoLip_ATPase_N domain-containing protein n=1 Tax=Nippostrongylus brasiliensis TaxID=27835 RepID=A0A0N4YW87_NIPBR
CGCCSKTPSSSSDVLQGDEERRLRANDREYNSQFKYAGNYIKTSKYNIITFIPQNLFEQFQRIANFYFLVLMILQFIPQISSISWYSTAIPLVIVLAFSAVKDGYDDMQRHISDRNVNGRKSFVVRNGHLNEEDWSKVRVGDVIRMMSNQFVAADLLLLSTSEPHGICYIETMELDGETNLKTRGAIPDTAEMGDDLDAISKFDGEVICEAPNNKLDKFRGKLIWQGRELPITNDNILLRGCILKNTRWNPPELMNKYESSHRRLSKQKIRSQQIAVISFLMFFSYVILLNTVVPISLYVSVEIIRFIHSMWINYDQEMYYENGEHSVPARAHTTTLNEELGQYPVNQGGVPFQIKNKTTNFYSGFQVQYVFSDKTGTLTRNIMTFNKCTINGISYGDLIDSRGEHVEITPVSFCLFSFIFAFSFQHYF